MNPRPKWNRVRVGDVCAVGDGAHASIPRTQAGVKYLSAKNFRAGGLQLESIEFISQESFERTFRERSKVPTVPLKGDVLVSIIGTLGEPYVVQNGDEFGLSSSVAILRPHFDKLFPEYLYYWMRSADFQDSIYGIKGGVAQSFVSLGMIKSLPVVLPPPDTQRKIAAVLSAYDDLIKNNNRRIKLLEEMAQRIYHEWFVDFRYPGHEDVPTVVSELGAIPEGWTVSNLGALFAVVLGGTPSRKVARYWENGTIPWINSGRVNDLRVMEPSELITMEALASSNAKVMPRGTTLVAITGATLGQVSLLEIAACANQSVVGIYDPKDRLTEFLYLTIHQTIERIISAASGGAQQHINQQIVRDTLISVPLPEVTRRFQVKERPLFDAIARLLRLQLNLQATCDVLLPRLISGEIDVTDLDIAMPEATA